MRASWSHAGCCWNHDAGRQFGRKEIEIACVYRKKPVLKHAGHPQVAHGDGWCRCQTSSPHSGAPRLAEISNRIDQKRYLRPPRPDVFPRVWVKAGAHSRRASGVTLAAAENLRATTLTPCHDAPCGGRGRYHGPDGAAFRSPTATNAGPRRRSYSSSSDKGTLRMIPASNPPTSGLRELTKWLETLPLPDARQLLNGRRPRDQPKVHAFLSSAFYGGTAVDVHFSILLAASFNRHLPNSLLAAAGVVAVGPPAVSLACWVMDQTFLDHHDGLTGICWRGGDRW